MNSPTPTQTAVLLKAAELIERFGWRQHVDHADSRLLLMEALAAGITGLPLRPLNEQAGEWMVYHGARDACLAVIGWDGGLLYRWAEVPGRTQDEVLDMLRRAAGQAA